MHSTDTRGADLRVFDAMTSELSRHYDARFEIGAALASRDIRRLSALAERLSREIGAWGRAIGELEAGAAGPLESHRSGRLLIESVFDEVLIPEATRVLTAAFALACPAP
jgi:hypothetical protein